MNLLEVKKALLLERLSLSPGQEERGFRDWQELPILHEDNVESRLVFLEAFRAAVTPILEKYLYKDNPKVVLEVGCGTGFFSRYLAPSWLEDKLFSFDINTSSLKTPKSKEINPRIFQASIYGLPLTPGNVDAVIGYSSFDSFLHLKRALLETLRVLRPGGKLLLFQDLITKFYDVGVTLPGNEKKETVERYHKILVEETEECGFVILGGKGKNEYLIGEAIEPISDVRRRVSDLEVEERPFPVFLLWDRGSLYPPARSSDREITGMTKEYFEKKINECNTLPKLTSYFNKIGARAGDLVEQVWMRYLVAQKSGKQ